MAAILACGPGSNLASLTAAVHLRTWHRQVTDIHVLAPRARRLHGVRVQTYRRLDTREVTIRDGIPVDNRAAYPGRPQRPSHRAPANVIHEAAFRNLYDERAVRAAMTRANGRHNLHVLEHALELNATGSAGTRSDLEDRFLALTSRSGLPEPLVNTQIETSRSTSTGQT